MLHKVKHQTKRFKITVSNRVPNIRSSQYLTNFLNFVRKEKPSGAIRAAMGLLQWNLGKKQNRKYCIAYKSTCFLTGRSRGISRRFSIARTKIKYFANQGRLFGVRKSSW